MSQIAAKEHKQAANKLKNVLATYNEAEDLINIGAYKKGSNPNIDYAISNSSEMKIKHLAGRSLSGSHASA